MAYAPVFVVQKHDARNLHYDFRLEVAGVLKSWAVPKGISMNPEEKRLAIATEDHVLSYAGFEGTIPEGQYGAGKVEIWDKGTYESKEPIEASLEKGRAEFLLKGKKLKGLFALIRTKIGWLLFKKADD
ncbi:MAG: DNA polymerase ligase N-terminal domain-containing protein [Candidatus Woesearchaeota archaeon]